MKTTVLDPDPRFVEWVRSLGIDPNTVANDGQFEVFAASKVFVWNEYTGNPDDPGEKVRRTRDLTDDELTTCPDP